MEYSLRKSQSLNHTNNGFSTFKLRNSCQKNPSSSSSPSIGEHYPVLPHHHHLHRNHSDAAVGRHPMTSTPPPNDRQVVVEIDASISNIQSKTPLQNNGNITPLSSIMYKQGQQETESESGRGSFTYNNLSTSSSPSVEFSFGRAETTDLCKGPTSESPLMGKYLEQQQSNSPREMSLNIDVVNVDIDELGRQQHQQQQHVNSCNQFDHSIRRQALQGLPPLHPDCQTKSLSRHPSDLQSPDFASNNNNNNNNNNVYKLTNNSSNGNTNHSSNNSNSNNLEGSRETRVSFQESRNPTGRSSFDDNDNDDDEDEVRVVDDDEDDDDDDDASSSKASDVHHDRIHDEEYGSTTRMISGGSNSNSNNNNNAHRRRFTKPSNGNSTFGNINSNNNNNDYNRGDENQEVVRCTSYNSTSRKLSSTVSIAKTKSRLMDPPMTPLDQRSTSGVIPKSGQISNANKSGFLGKSYEEEEDDPFLEDDFPEEFKAGQIGTLVILEWVSLVILIGSLVCSLIIPVLKNKSIWKLKLWKWEIFGLSLVCGRLVSGWLVKLLVFFIERNFMLRKRILYFVYGLKKAVQNVLWLGLVLLTWHCIFNGEIETRANSEPLKIITKLVVLGEVGAVLWLIKTLMVKVCASTFHVNAFFDRIQESLFNQFVIETLSAPPMFELRSAQEEEDRAMAEVQMLQNAGINVPPELNASVHLSRSKSGMGVQLNSQGSKTLGPNNSLGTPPIKSPVRQSLRYSGPISRKYHDEGITIDRLHKLNQKNVSAWNMKRLIKIVRHGFLTTLDEQIENTNTNHEDESATQIRSEVEAKAAARKIFRNVAKPGSKFIYLNDLVRFMQEDEAIKTMNLFEGAYESGKISKPALKNWVVNAFRERRALALTLGDTKTAVNKLHKMVDVLVSIIIILIFVVELHIISSKSVIFLSSQLVLVAFVFGNTCRNVFESIIFLFVIHPFDVGDRCEIDGVQMIVEEMNILNTIFLRYDNQKIMYPNYILLSKPIHNFYRSPDMGDAIEFCIHVATPPDRLTLIRQRITSYIVNKKEHWYPDPMIVTKDAENLYMLRIAVWVTHRMNYQDIGERWVRRAQLVEECIKIFRELDVEYRPFPTNVNANANASTMMPPIYFGLPNLGSDPFISEGAKEVVNR